MGCPRLALEVWGADPEQLLVTAATAEELGLHALYYGESPHGLNLETFTVLALLAARTRRLRVGPVIANLLPGYRTFPQFARQVHAMTVISGGRFDLRTGTGAAARWARPWWEPAGVDYPGRDRRREVLADWLAALHARWTADGTVRPPVTVAASGPRSMRVAARWADEWECSFRTPGELRELAARFDALPGSSDGREASADQGLSGGRGPSGGPGASGGRIRRSVELDLVTAGTADARERLTRRFLAERGPGGPAALERALTGGPGELAERLHAYREAGADQLLLAAVDPHDPDTLRTLAEAAARCP
jgi:alkanesulfonate monooxygenase SsuD/methylene tetrahydromethanopterin reductase-like flavin-dependent oxidoreductase (luciferase family)